ncbi:MAG TPA: MFS transporter [Candidatus Limnocylindrales bacterium]|jgi:MFS family permease
MDVRPAWDVRPAGDVRPGRSLGLLSAAHAVNHSFAVLLPLIFLAIIDEFGASVQDVAFLAAAGSLLSGLIQLSYVELTRHVPRKRLLGVGGLLFGGGFAAMSLASNFLTFAVPTIAARIGGSPQHPVGNGLLAEQYPPERRGFAISAHIAGGNLGTVLVAVVGAPMLALIGWRGASILFGVAAMVIAVAILALVREHGTDRAAARAGGSSLDGLKRVVADRDLRWVFLTSVLGGGGRGLGVVNLFALIYLTRVIGLDEGTSGLMYGALIVFSVPIPLLAGWLSDRLGRKPLIIAAYLGGAIGFGLFIFAGSSLLWLWVGIVVMGLFSFAESPQLQALLADMSPPESRDASYALYFTLAFGVGSLWTAIYGTVIEQLGEPTGVPVVFGIMAVSFLAAAVATLPIRTERAQRARHDDWTEGLEA